MKLDINGAVHDIDAPPDMPLLWALRDLLGLTGTKVELIGSPSGFAEG